MKFWITMCLLMPIQVLAHGLNITSAQITQRHDNHLTIHITLSVMDLAKRLNWENKPPTMMHLVGAKPVQFEHFHRAINYTFTQDLKIVVGGALMESKQVRLPNATELQKTMQTAFASNVIPKDPESHAHNDSAHAIDRIKIFIDGFVSKKAIDRVLRITFPEVIVPITVSYSKPKVQTLMPKQGPAIYQEQIQ